MKFEWYSRLFFALIFAGFLIIIGSCGTYASDRCQECHAEKVESFALTLHAQYGTCNICHGDGEEHLVEPLKEGTIINPGNLGLEKSKSICLNCHEEKEEYLKGKFRSVVSAHEDLSCYQCHTTHLKSADDMEYLALFKTDLSVNCNYCHRNKADDILNSPHGSIGLKCSDCHKWHIERTISQDIEEQIETCLFCHPNQELEFRHRFIHPLREEQIKCASCHNPHSDRYEHMLKKDGDKTCYECHTDIKIESGRHPASRGTEHSFGTVKCMDCHRPHGSHFDKILKHDIDNLCTTCHN